MNDCLKIIFTKNNNICLTNINLPKKIIDNFNYFEINIDKEEPFFIDEISYSILNSNKKYFYAIPIPDSENIRILKPVEESDFKNSENLNYEYKDPVKLGEGSFGIVHGYENEGSVIKTSLAANIHKDLPEDIIKEIAIYNFLKYINCIPKLQNFNLNNKISMQFEKGVSTLSYQLEKKSLSFDIRKEIMLKLAICLNLTSSQGIVHLDLKPDNMIIVQDENIRIQIIDWGAAEILLYPSQIHHLKQTLWWRSPELCVEQYPTRDFSKKRYDYKADIFSLGLIFIQLFKNNSIPINNATTELEYVKNLLIFVDEDLSLLNNDTIYSVLDEYIVSDQSQQRLYDSMNNFFSNKSFLDLVCKMLNYNPNLRIGYEEIIKHPFFEFDKKIPEIPKFINNMPVINIEIGKNFIKRLNYIEYILKYSNKLDLQTFCLSIQIYDLLCDKVGASNISSAYEKACLIIASDIFGITNVKASYLVNLSKSQTDIFVREKEIMNILGGDIIHPTLMSYFYIKNKKCDTSSRLKILGYYNRPDVYTKKFVDIDIDNYKYLKIKKIGSISFLQEEVKQDNEFVYIANMFKIKIEDFKKAIEIGNTESYLEYKKIQNGFVFFGKS